MVVQLPKEGVAFGKVNLLVNPLLQKNILRYLDSNALTMYNGLCVYVSQSTHFFKVLFGAL